MFWCTHGMQVVKDTMHSLEILLLNIHVIPVFLHYCFYIPTWIIFTLEHISIIYIYIFLVLQTQVPHCCWVINVWLEGGMMGSHFFSSDVYGGILTLFSEHDFLTLDMALIGHIMLYMYLWYFFFHRFSIFNRMWLLIQFRSTCPIAVNRWFSYVLETWRNNLHYRACQDIVSGL